MKITLIVTGKTDEPWLREGLDVYVKRLKHYIPFEFKVIPELKNTRNLSAQQQKEKEGRLMRQVIDERGEVYLLDEGGIQLSSRGLAGFIEKKMVASGRELVFIIGGPFGFSEDMHSMAKGRISLSMLTFSHQMVRLLFVEQLYRAFTIIRGEAYHHD